MCNVLVILYVSKRRSQPWGIVTLPVHDAISVKQVDAEWAKGAMQRVWTLETLGGQTCLRVDFPY